MQTGLVSVTFRKLKPENIVSLVRQAGLDGIEWGADIHVPPGCIENAIHVRELTEEAGLKVFAYGSYYRTIVEGSVEVDFAPVLATAKALGAPLIRVWAGVLGSHDLDLKARQALVLHSRRIAEMAEAEGIRIACEYHSGTITDTPDSALRFVEDVGHPNYRSLWQTPIALGFEERLASLRSILPYLENIHVFNWKKDPQMRYPLSEAEADWNAYLELVRQSGKSPACLLEFVAGDNPAQLLQDAATLIGWTSAGKTA